MDWHTSLVIVICIAISSNCIYEVSSEENDPVVKIESGSVRGFHMTSRSGRKYYAFTKIPYAQPPVGPLRFKKGDSNVKWDENVILDANENLPDCVQVVPSDVVEPNSNTKNITIGTEDCLYLSVFTPKVGSESKDLPVMIYIHGGGWRSEQPAYGSLANRSTYLMDEDVILIMFHYRLGALGFLSTEDAGLPGNLGMKDQVLVIEWVKKNIDKFGGDSNKITLFGNGAGGASTHYHLISPLSKDLIQGGISESGVATDLWAFSVPGNALKKAKKVANHLGCPEQPSEHLVSCLRTKSAKDITNAENIFNTKHLDLFIVFPPVIESGPDAFLTDSPYNFKVDKPWIIGVNSEDGALNRSNYKLQPEVIQSFLKGSVYILPDLMMFSDTTEDPKQIASEILDHYVNKEELTDLTNIWIDGIFTYGADQAIKRSEGNTYQYVFEFKGNTGVNDEVTAKMGIFPMNEVVYLLNFEDKDEYKLLEADEKVSKRLVKMWTDFAKFGYPKFNEDWKPYKNDKTYLKILKDDSVEKDLWPSRLNFWRNLPIRNKLEKLNL